MKTEIYYFTGTGNSLVVARDLAKELNGELIAIPSVMSKETINVDAEVIGVVFPVYIWGMPLIVTRFINKLENLKDKYVFAVATCGGMPGATINQFEKVLENRGGQLAVGFTVIMPGNYTPMYGAIEERKQMQMFKKWDYKLKIICKYVKDNKRGIKENNNVFVNLIFSSFIYNLSPKHIPKMDRQFWFDENCNKCGICKKVCPVDNITITEGSPTWNGNCEQCFACLQWCPQKAIQWGKNTQNRKRYHHPDIKISDIMK